MSNSASSFETIGIVGAGAWGTALATVAQRAGCTVILQAHEPEVAEAINRDHQNQTFLPDIALDPAIKAVTDPRDAAAADAVLLVTPAQHLRAVTKSLAGVWRKGQPVVICSKGIEQESGALMSEIVAETLPEAAVAILSGPTFAAEVALGMPTAVSMAAADVGLAEALAGAIGSARFRAYHSTDPIGVQIGGAVKNVMAVACGIAEGRALGDNARAALITRGLAEMGRLVAAKGGQPETLMGLSGLGDLTLTCTGLQSRNYSLGQALGQGQPLADLLDGRKTVAEGVFTAASVSDLARRLKIDLPICQAVDGILNHFADIDATIEGLLARPMKAEAGDAGA
jgi:glycerol-3-phosphate dehydrogenase (NAD(P)+)